MVVLLVAADCLSAGGCAGAPASGSVPAAKNDGAAAPAVAVNDATAVAGREALKMVGLDAAADKVWTSAINNPKNSAEDRQGLIEDLNEVGFGDPAHPTKADLPKIKARIALIDKLSPSAMDDTNRAAFKEARKDLVDMVDFAGK